MSMYQRGLWHVVKTQRQDAGGQLWTLARWDEATHDFEESDFTPTHSYAIACEAANQLNTRTA